MRIVVTRNTKTCDQCGKTVAVLRSRNDRPYPVNIKRALGTGEVEAGVADFHNCPRPSSGIFYRGAVQFLSKAAARSSCESFRVSLRSADGLPVALLYRRAKHVIYVTDGQPYGSNRYYGAIDLGTGEWRNGRQQPPGTIIELLALMSADPAGAAAAYGRATGECCFCRLQLTDERSILTGYGKRCAEKFGLPWGAAGEGSAGRASRTLAVLSGAVAFDDDDDDPPAGALAA